MIIVTNCNGIHAAVVVVIGAIAGVLELRARSVSSVALLWPTADVLVSPKIIIAAVNIISHDLHGKQLRCKW